MFRFSIRDLMLALLVVGMGLGWWSDRCRLRSEIQKSGERAEFLKWQQDEVLVPQVARREAPRAFSRDTYERLRKRH